MPGRFPQVLSRSGSSRLPAGKKPDIEFGTGAGEGSVAVRYFVPVAALGAGVDALTAAQLQDIWAARTTDWGDVGGVPGHIALASGPDTQAGDLSLIKENADHFNSYDALRSAMTIDSGIVTFVPIEELRPSMVAIAVDGTDIARGIGDPAAWPFAERIEVVANTKAGEAALESDPGAGGRETSDSSRRLSRPATSCSRGARSLLLKRPAIGAPPFAAP